MYWVELRAKDEVRTRDLNLGKVALYQLSYFRIYFNIKDGRQNYWIDGRQPNFFTC